MSKAVAKSVPTPKPVTVKEVCSVCGEDWAEHPEDATTLDCIEIVKAKNVELSLKVASPGCCHHVHWTYQTYPWYNSNSNTIDYRQPVQITYTAPEWTTNTPLASTDTSFPALMSSVSA